MYDPAAPSGPNGEQVSARVQLERWWGTAFREAKLSLEDLLPYRVRVAWRVTREWQWQQYERIEAEVLR